MGPCSIAGPLARGARCGAFADRASRRRSFVDLPTRGLPRLVIDAPMLWPAPVSRAFVLVASIPERRHWSGETQSTTTSGGIQRQCAAGDVRATVQCLMLPRSERHVLVERTLEPYIASLGLNS